MVTTLATFVLSSCNNISGGVVTDDTNDNKESKTVTFIADSDGLFDFTDLSDQKSARTIIPAALYSTSFKFYLVYRDTVNSTSDSLASITFNKEKLSDTPSAETDLKKKIVLPKRNLDKNNKANKVYNTQWRAHLMAERKRYSAEEKSAIVLEILQDGKKVSDVAEEHGIHPNQIMLWKKQALENMAELFKTERKDITAKKEQREISELKSQIAHKDSVIAELADENMSLKKKSFGLRLTK